MSESAIMSEPVVLIPPEEREFLPASIPGVTVCRPWADPRSELYVPRDMDIIPVKRTKKAVKPAAKAKSAV